MDNIQEFMENHNTMTLATQGMDGTGAAAVFYTTIKKSTSLVFVSNPESEHIKNLEINKMCAATIQDDGLEWKEIKGLQLKGEINQAKEKYWENYLRKYPYIRTDEELSKALEKVNLYEFRITWARLIDNTKGFGNRTEVNY